jgi:sialidase-1
MKRLKLLDDGVIYKNPDPGQKAECAFLPNVVPLDGDDVLCIYRIGQAFYSTDGTLNVARSTDGGKTWVQEGRVWDVANDDRLYNYSAPHAFRLKDGTLVLTAFRMDFSDPRPQFNPETGGHRASDKIVFFSDDGGRTWTSPRVMDLPLDSLPDTPSSIIELNDGRWWMGLELWKEWDHIGPLHIKGFSTFSDDRGETWSDAFPLESASDTEKMFSHSRYVKMLDGRVAGLQWTQEPGTAKDFAEHITISNADASAWSYPEPTNLMAQTCWLADLGSGVMAAAYTDREGMNPGINVVLSRDEGKTWDVENQVQVWGDAVGQEYLGVERTPEYPKSHDNIAFGKPNLARMADGTLIASWWCTQASVTHSRFARLKVE